MRVSTIVVVLTLVATACSAADDVVRVGLRGGRTLQVAVSNTNEVGRSATYFDDISRHARRSSAVDDLYRRAAVARATQEHAQLEQALGALAWDVACDIVAGNVPANEYELAVMLAHRATNFGLTFANAEAALPMAELLWQSLSTQDQAARAAVACAQVPSSGF